MNVELFAELIGATIANAQTASASVASVPEVELPDDWKEFEETLGRFKKEYVETLSRLTHHEQDVRELKKVQSLIRRMGQSTIRARIESIVDEYEQPEHEYVELAGKVRAMERVLMHTNAQQVQPVYVSGLHGPSIKHLSGPLRSPHL
jgi:chromosome segregation ATPase